jgi:hypothetical protein
MVTQVTDTRSNSPEQIANAARVIRGSQIRRTVFSEVVRGREKSKAVGDIAKRTRLSRKQVLTAGKYLADHDVVEQGMKGNDIAYQKVPVLAQNRKRVLSLAASPQKLAGFPTKSNPVMTTVIRIAVPRPLVRTKQITVDDFDSFRSIRRVAAPPAPFRMPENAFKQGVARILNETGEFKDWGGEKGDLFTTQLAMVGKRFAAAFAFKGPGTSGRLTPARLGKNGDQIQRLFTTDAEVFVVQYWDRIDESVLTQMGHAAVAKSYATGKKIYYGVMDGRDSSRLIAAYPTAFELAKDKK